ncbi:MAG: SDR family NAD(P)-dependent oxidoreductase [Thermodesulfobacteriota bacterium]
MLHDRDLVVIAEVCDEAAALAAQAAGADGLLAKGNEAGGLVGEETAFILLQRLLDRVSLPVWVQGGIGLHTAAASYVAGAAGVVLDSQLLACREAGLPEAVTAFLERMDGGETVCLGGGGLAQLRCLARPAKGAWERLRLFGLELADEPGPGAAERWRQAAGQALGWGALEEAVWPLGQDAALAVPYARRFRTVAGVLAALRRAVDEQVTLAAEQKALAQGAPLARSLGTAYPIVQGPMAQVSDRPAFALAVAEGGGLPCLALSWLRGPEIRSLVTETRTLLGERPWGVGVIGFARPELREEQFAALTELAPPLAVLAGGRPEQVEALTAAGIRVFTHVPSAGLLRMFLDRGATGFIFEGRECGGHVGPRSSFLLWEQAVSLLLAAVPATEASRYEILFAGGIHDARSSAMVAAIAAPLVARGMAIGVLMGTGYLFTAEAVATGAILPGFQEEAIRCQDTVLLETSPGHASRCVPTPFAAAFTAERRRLLRQGLPAAEAGARLEGLTRGRLRMAAKGLAADPKAPQVPERALDRTAQEAEGLYLIGQLAALHDRPASIAGLHQAVAASADLLAACPPPALAAGQEPRRPASCDVAIIGMAGFFPGASDLAGFWENILDRHDAVTEVPASRWDWRHYFDPDPKARDKVVSRWGGFLDPVPFNPLAYGMPPATIPFVEPLHLITLEAVRAALTDAGYEDRDFPRERTAVVLGVGGGTAELGQLYALRSVLSRMTSPEAAWLLDRLPEWTEDSFPGILLNVTAGRVANRFDLGGPNYTVDAACAASLAAVYAGVRELTAGACDLVLAGGGDTVQSPFAFLSFSKTHALSPTGRCRTFDEAADGIAISEGVAVLVLKRLADAERDGDRIYAVIKAVAGSSDGRDKGLTAPRPEGQARALVRAYHQAGFGPDTVGLIEAHGTGTVVGDRAEIETLRQVFAVTAAKPASCALGSVKSMIGHTKTTAGVAGMMKVALALYHRVLPPTLHVTRPNASLAGSPFYVNSATRPWLAAGVTPRRAGVSAFGFGGTNFHAVLEEHDADLPVRPAVRDHWPAELFVLAGETRPMLAERLERLAAALANGAAPALGDLALGLWRAWGQGPVRLAVVATSREELAARLAQARAALAAGSEELDDRRGIYGRFTPTAAGQVAFLFPGQGSQYPDMLRDLAVLFPEVAGAFEAADRLLAGRLETPLSALVFPPPAFDEGAAREARRRLTRTDVAQPAMGAADVGLCRLLASLGVRPAMTAGHSYGEYVALWAAGVLDEETLFALSSARGRLMLAAAGQDLGTMAAVEADRQTVAAALEGVAAVWPSNCNSPRQTLVAGSQAGVAEATGILASQGLKVSPVPVSCPFHSPLMAPVQADFAPLLATAAFRPPRLPVFSNTLAGPYPEETAGYARLLADHIVTPVAFVDEIEAMYQAGARIFVEVGPKSVLANLTRQILAGRPHTTVALDSAEHAGLAGLLHGLGQLLAAGVPVHLDRLFAGRQLLPVDPEGLSGPAAARSYPAGTWLVDGGRAWPASEPAPARPILDQPPAEVLARSEAPLPAGPPAIPLPAAAPLAGAGAPQPGLDAVLGEFQRLMQQFLATQQEVMTAYLGGASATPLPAMPAAEIPARPAAPAAAPPAPARPQPAATPPPVPSPPPAPAAAPAPAAKAADPAAVLLRLVSERTGYPAEMLGLDLDLEADLGIDSIKRVEILTSLETALGLPAAGLAMEEVGRMRSLRQIIGHLARLQPAAPTPAAAPAGQPAGPAVEAVLLGLVSERTGYPAGMLGLDLDLEADLGIDSIKRVEILGSLLTRLGPGGAGEGLEELGRLKTLRQIRDRLTRAGGSPAASPAAPKATAGQPAAVPPPRAASDDRAAPRQLTELVPLPAAGQCLVPPAGGLFLIVEDAAGVGRELADRIRERGGKALRVVAGETLRQDDVPWQADLASPAGVQALLAAVRAEAAPLAGLVHLAGLAPVPDLAGMDGAAWQAWLDGPVKGLYLLAQAAGPELAAAAGWLLVATAGAGLDPAAGQVSPAAAGLAGFVRCLAEEWPQVRCRLVDLAVGAAAVAAERLLAEMADTGAPLEVAYRGGSRLRPRTRLAPLDRRGPPRLAIDRDWVILLTGGSRGITAEVAADLGERFQPTLILAGRTPPPGAVPMATAGVAEPRLLKQAIIAELTQAQGRPPAPAQVESEYRRLVKEREVRATMARLVATGARVEYQAVDVCDETAMQALLAEIVARYGRLDLVVHGAGLIEDKLVADKTPESFDRVFRTKTASAFILARHLRPDSLAGLVFFTSVAGRFGNRGQADYGAANEVVNGLAVRLNALWPGRVVGMSWGPWLGTGMVTPEVERQFERRGIKGVPMDVGRRLVADEILYGPKEEPVVVIGGGPWLENDPTQPGGGR